MGGDDDDDDVYYFKARHKPANTNWDIARSILLFPWDQGFQGPNGQKHDTHTVCSLWGKFEKRVSETADIDKSKKNLQESTSDIIC